MEVLSGYKVRSLRSLSRQDRRRLSEIGKQHLRALHASQRAVVDGDVVAQATATYRLGELRKAWLVGRTSLTADVIDRTPVTELTAIAKAILANDERATG